MKSKALHKFLAGAGLGILVAIIVWFFTNYLFAELFYSYEAKMYDWRSGIKISDVPSQSIEDIVIVDIDGRSISELGKFYQWPHK